MPPLVQNLLSDPLTYLLVAAIWLGKLYLERRLSRGVDQRFDERLETHKHSLDLLTEQARHDYQLQLANFNLYAARRHAAAEAVYAAVRIAHGYVSGLFGVRVALTFDEFNRQDITAHMNSRQVPAGEQEEVLGLWDANRPAAIGLLQPYLRMLDVQEADNKFREAKNLTYLNELYLSDDAIAALDEVSQMLAEWLGYAQFPRGPGERWRPDTPRLNSALDKLHGILRSELSGASKTPTPAHPAPPAERVGG